MTTNEKALALANELYKTLKENGKTLSTAESCTGGMIGQYLTSVPGISDHYGYGFVTYSNEAKEELLGVKKETLNQFGAVSPQTVVQMAQGALEKSGSHLAASVSGIAGPGGGSAQKPVGLVYVGIAKEGSEAKAYELRLSGTRQEVREKTVCRVFELLKEALMNEDEK